MNCLVTGAAGFIGSHLVDKLLLNGHSVIGIDSMANGCISNLEAAKKNQNFKFIHGDICIKKDLYRCFNEKKINIVFHLAAIGSIPRSIYFPKKTFKSNVIGFHHVLSSAVEHSVKRLVYSSSSSVYGNISSEIKNESYLGKTLSPYAMSKRINEIQAEAYSMTYEIECIGLRYFNVFGPRQKGVGKYAAVIPKWINCIKNNRTIKLNGSGSKARDFTYVDNIVDMNVLCGLSENISTPNVFNVGCGELTSLNKLLDELKEISKNKKIYWPDIIIKNERKGDVKYSRAFTENAKIIGYNPQISFKEGIKKLCDIELGSSEMESSEDL